VYLFISYVNEGNLNSSKLCH